MAKRKSVRRVSKKMTTQKKKKLPILFIIAPIVLIFCLYFVYIFLIYPKELNKKIIDKFIELAKPLYYEESKDLAIFKIPNENTIPNLKSGIYQTYKLTLDFHEVTIDNKSIKKVSFYKNNYLLKEIKDIYVYYDIKRENYTFKEEDLIKKDVEKIKNIREQDKIVKKKNIPTNKDISIQQKRSVQDKNRQNIVKTHPDNSPVKEDKAQKKSVEREYPYKVSIVIDDVGYDNDNIYKFVKLNLPLTFAIIPETPYAKKSYDLIQSYGFDTILHIPMEPEKGEKFVEKNGLLSSLDNEELDKRVKYFIDLYPKVIGANNHMGSKAVTDERIMTLLFSNLSQKNLFWLDSYTTPNSIAKDVAQKFNLKNFRRDVFLDNEDNYQSIKNSFLKLVNEAKSKRYAIGIGHIQSKELIGVLKEFELERAVYKIDFSYLKDLE